MNLLRDESGQTMVLMALCFACVVGMGGFSVDAGMMFRAKRVMQNAADGGAIAGIAELNYGDVTTAAKAAAAQNGVTDGSNGATVTVNNPPVYGPHAGNSAYVEVITSQSEPTYFMRIFHVNSITVGARSVAGLVPTTTCIYAQGTSGTDLSLTGSGSLSIPDCGIGIDSSSSSALKMVGSGSIKAQSINIVGGYSLTGSGSLNPTPTTGAGPVSNPLSGLTPPPYDAASCVANPNITGSSNRTLGPVVAGGTICYNGLSITGSGSLTLQPGVYVINGSLSSTGSGSISGTDVTIYFPGPSGSFSMTGSGSLNLTAPTSGTNNGILFEQSSSDTTAMKMTGSGSANLQGIIDAPAAALDMTGSGSGTMYTDLIVSSISQTGSGTLKSYSDVNSSSPLSTATLVE